MKLLAWTRDSSWCWADLHPRHRDGAELRRRNRAREAAVVRREVDQLELTCIEPGCHPRFHDSYWDMNDDSRAPTTAVWRALIENEEGLRFINFRGTYTVETREE